MKLLGCSTRISLGLKISPATKEVQEFARSRLRQSDRQRVNREVAAIEILPNGTRLHLGIGRGIGIKLCPSRGDVYA
jgi:hypothetical protein